MPYATYLVFGVIYNSKGDISPNSSIECITSIGRRTYTSDSEGIYLFDLADIGYVSGETVSINVVEPFNNEYKNHTFIVSGASHEENLTLTLRTQAVNATDYSPKTILHSVGKKPITSDNPLPVLSINNNDIDLLNNPQWEWTWNENGLVNETVTMLNGDVYLRTTTYNGDGRAIKRTKWAKQ